MNKALVVIGDTRVEEDSGIVALVYSVTVIGDSHGRYNSDYVLDLRCSLRDNVNALLNKITTYIKEKYRVELEHGDVIIFGAPIVENEDAMTCCAKGMTSVNRSLSGKLGGFGSMVKSFFTPPDPVVQVVQENDPRVEEHDQKLQELDSRIDSVKSEMSLLQEELKTLIAEHDHPYPDSLIRLEGEVNSVLVKLHQHREHTSALHGEVIHRIHVLENPSPKEEPIPEVVEEKAQAEAKEVIEEKVESEGREAIEEQTKEKVKEVIEEVNPIEEQPVEEVTGVWRRFERWVQNLWV